MRIEQLGHFLAVVETGSMRQAAQQLGLTQPAISKSIGTLENELDARLLQRSTRGISVTPQGKAFASRARAIQAEWRKAQEELAHDGREAAPRVAIGLGQSSAMLVLPEAMADFRQAWPAARVRVVEGLPGLLLPMLRDESLDFIVGGDMARRDAAFKFRPLYRSARVIVGRQGHPLRKARSLAQLQSAEWILTPPLESPNAIDAMFAAAGLPAPRCTLQCESYHTATAMLASSDMLAVMSQRQLEAPYAAATLEALDVAHSAPPFTVGLYTRADVRLSAAAAALARDFTRVARRLATVAQG